MENAKRSALQRMRKVIKVCEDAVRSEFPSFDGMMAFHVFNLKEDVGCPTSSGLQDMISSGQRHFHKPCEGESLERLALIFEVSRDKLIAEFEYLHGVASACMKTAGVSNRESWQWAWRKCSGRKDMTTLEPATCTFYYAFAFCFSMFHGKPP